MRRMKEKNNSQYCYGNALRGRGFLKVENLRALTSSGYCFKVYHYHMLRFPHMCLGYVKKLTKVLC